MNKTKISATSPDLNKDSPIKAGASNILRLSYENDKLKNLSNEKVHRVQTGEFKIDVRAIDNTMERARKAQREARRLREMGVVETEQSETISV